MEECPREGHFVPGLGQSQKSEDEESTQGGDRLADLR